jgi:hypothetical protein
LYFSSCSLASLLQQRVGLLTLFGPLYPWAKIKQLLGHPHFGGKPNPTG